MSLNIKLPVPDDSYREEHYKNYLEKYEKFDAYSMGESILSKNMYCYKIGTGACRVFYVGAHHALEYMTASLLYDFIDFLAERATRGGTYYGIDIRFLLLRYTFWILPCANPDGVDIHLGKVLDNPLRERQIKMNGGDCFDSWQANARGVDLNHNYDCGFFEYKHKIEWKEDISAGPTLFSGEYPESEPEVSHIASFVRSVRPSLVISLHSQGEEIYSYPDTPYVSRMAARFATLTGYSQKRASGTAAYGGLSDYAGRVLGIPSFTFEVGRGKNPLPHSAYPLIREITRKLLYLAPSIL